MPLIGWFSLDHVMQSGFVVYKTMDGAHVVLSQVTSKPEVEVYTHTPDAVRFGQVSDVCVVSSRTIRCKHPQRHTTIFFEKKVEPKGFGYIDFNKNTVGKLEAELKEAGIETVPIPVPAKLPTILIIDEVEKAPLPDLSEFLDVDRMAQMNGEEYVPDFDVPDHNKDRPAAIAYLKMVILRDHGIFVLVPESPEDITPDITV